MNHVFHNKEERYLLVAAETGPFGRILNLVLVSPERPVDVTSNCGVAALEPYLEI